MTRMSEWVDMLKEKSLALYEKLSKSKTFNASVQYTGSQFIEGVKAVANFPFTTAKMLFYPKARRLVSHTLEYNGVYYLVPILAYGLARGQISQTPGPLVATCVTGVDMLMNLYLFRAATNAYLMNVVINMNAQSITINEGGNEKNCDCDVSEKKWGALMSPLYYMVKAASLPLLSKLDWIGGFFRYGFRPLLFGQALVESNMTGLCAKHRVESFSENLVINLGVGYGALIAVHLLSNLAFNMTGAQGAWVEDAIFNLLFPFMVFHLRNNRHALDARKGFPIDLFLPWRTVVDATLARVNRKDFRDLLSIQDKKLLLDHFKNVWRSRSVKTIRRFLLYPSLNRISGFSEQGPVRLIIDENRDKIDDIIGQVATVTQYPRLTSWGLWFTGFFVSIPQPVTQVVKTINTDPKQAQELLSQLKGLLDPEKGDDSFVVLDSHPEQERERTPPPKLITPSGELELHLAAAMNECALSEKTSTGREWFVVDHKDLKPGETQSRKGSLR